MSEDDPIERLASFDNYDKRQAGRLKGDTYIFLSARIKNGWPFLYVSVGNQKDRQWFESVEELDAEFERLMEKHDLEEN